MSILFEPFKIGNFEIKNRFVRSATYYALSDENGFPGEKSTALMKTLAENEVGLIVTGYAYVQKNGQCFIDMNGIQDDDHIPGFQKMTKAVHDAGGKIVMQIAHGGISATTAARTGGDLVAVSVPKNHDAKGGKPRQLSAEDIETMIYAFGEAARRVQEAGFDGVQLHGAHGYIFTQFLSPLSNQRNDRWGGSLENRMRFVVETTRAMKRKVGPDFPVMIKLGCRDYCDENNRFTIEEGAKVVRALEKEGHAHIEISYATLGKAHQKLSLGVARPDQEAYLLPDARIIRKATRMPLGLVGGMRSLPVMEEIVSSGIVDTISISRPLIREPDLIKRWNRGDAKTADCISCGRCFSMDGAKRQIRCSQI